MLSVFIWQILASKNCRTQEQLHETVMNTALQRLGDSIGDEVAKLEAEEHQFDTVLEDISPEPPEDENGAEDQNGQLAMKADAAPTTPPDECTEVRAQLVELTEVICECRDVHNELREVLKLKVEAACSSGGMIGPESHDPAGRGAGALIVLIWTETLRLKCHLMGLGKVELGDSASPQHNANPADLLLLVAAR